MWQAIRTDLHPQGFEVVSVALDTGGPDAARRFVEDAGTEHPALIDEAHVLDELLGIVNVPTGVWIDEDGMIVRPPEPAHARTNRMAERPVPEGLDERTRDLLVQVGKLRSESDRYKAALRDWVERGAASPHALAPDEVVRRSRPQTIDAATAAAAFELGQHLHRSGDADGAVPWFREAHRRQPENWTYKRQAWTFVDANQGPNDVYDGNWLDDVKAIGAENYYPGLDL